jgi:hypothetical protein
MILWENLFGSHFIENVMVALDVIRPLSEANLPCLSNVEISIPLRIRATKSLLANRQNFCFKEYSRYDGHEIPRRLFKHLWSQSILFRPSIPFLLL